MYFCVSTKSVRIYSLARSLVRLFRFLSLDFFFVFHNRFHVRLSFVYTSPFSPCISSFYLSRFLCLPPFVLPKSKGIWRVLQPLIWNIYRVSAFSSQAEHFSRSHSLILLFSIPFSSLTHFIYENFHQKLGSNTKIQLNAYFWMMLSMIIMTTIAIGSCLMRTMLCYSLTHTHTHTRYTAIYPS